MTVYQNKEAKHLVYGGKLISKIYAGNRELFSYNNLKFLSYDKTYNIYRVLYNGRKIEYKPEASGTEGYIKYLDNYRYIDASAGTGITDDGSLVLNDGAIRSDKGGYEWISGGGTCRNGDLFYHNSDGAPTRTALENCTCAAGSLAISEGRLFYGNGSTAYYQISDKEGWTDVSSYFGICNEEIYVFTYESSGRVGAIDYVGRADGLKKFYLYDVPHKTVNINNVVPSIRWCFVHNGDLYYADVNYTREDINSDVTLSSTRLSLADSGGWESGGGLTWSDFSYAYGIKNGKVYKLPGMTQVSGIDEAVCVSGEAVNITASSYYNVFAGDKAGNLYRIDNNSAYKLTIAEADNA